jgi:hypothetical protein
MSYQIGTATDYKDLLSKLKAFITTGLGADNWTTKVWNTDYDGDGEYEFVAMGPGSTATDEIYVGIRTYKNVTEDLYNWALTGYTGYSAESDFFTHPGALRGARTYLPHVLLWNSTIPYWFVANGRRFIVVAKVSLTYEAAYMGFLLPYGTPSQIPYPLVIGGSCAATTDTDRRWSNIDATHRAFVDPYGTSLTSETAAQSTLWILNTQWYGCGNYTSNEETGSQYSRINVWPFVHGEYNGASTAPDANYLWLESTTNLDGSYPLVPLIVAGKSPQINFYGELQSCYGVPGLSLSAEDTIDIGAVQHVIFQNTYHAELYNYWALRLE